MQLSSPKDPKNSQLIKLLSLRLGTPFMISLRPRTLLFDCSFFRPDLFSKTWLALTVPGALSDPHSLLKSSGEADNMAITVAGGRARAAIF